MDTITDTLPALTEYASPAPARSVRPAWARLLHRPLGRVLSVLALLTIAGGGAAGTRHYLAGFESTDDAFLEGDVHPVSARISGTVTRVLVDDNNRVQAGDPLVELDDADLNLAVQGAEADLAEARAGRAQAAAQTDRARAEIEAAAARMAQNAAQLHRAELDFHRMEMLAADNVRAVATQELDAARAAYDSIRGAQQTLVAEHASATAGLVAAEAQDEVLRARMQKAEAALGTARLQAGYTVIRATGPGRIAKKNVEVGQRLQPGQPLMAVVEDRVWVVANFKESQLAGLRPGARATIRVDAVDGRAFAGTVESFAPGTGARFSLLPPDNAAGNFTKVVQRVPVKILFSPDTLGSAAVRLAPGLSATVRISLRP